jgi:hypothetical protein
MRIIRADPAFDAGMVRGIGAIEFDRIVRDDVAPALLGTVSTVLMLWARPPVIPLWAVWAAIVAQAIVWCSTATIQVPIQVQLSAHGRSLELIEWLITTNFWLRRIPYAVCAALFLWMASRAIGVRGRDSGSRQSDGGPT